MSRNQWPDPGQWSDAQLWAEVGRLEELAWKERVPVTPAPAGWEPGMELTPAHCLQRLAELRAGFDSGIRYLQDAELYRALKGKPANPHSRRRP